jgi:putative DNA primase/helicase
VFRAIDKWYPTLLIDEADSFLRDNEELRGILNSGHGRANAYVIRTVGENYEPMHFSTWSAKAIALIGKLPATLASRAIHIELRRMKADEHVEPLRLDRLDHLKPLMRQAVRWAADNAEALRSADPELPEGLYGRPADNWRPLFAIADLAGGEWPERARGVAEKLNAEITEQTAGIVLLEDVRAIFTERAADRLTSVEMIEALVGMEHRPWPEWKMGKPITPRQLAKLLEPFGVTPTSIRTATGKTPKGYHLDAFDDAFSRFLPSESATPPQPAESLAF